MEGLRTSSGSFSKGVTVPAPRGGGHRFVPFLKPLLQQQCRSSTVKTAAAIPPQTETVGGTPAAGMFIDPRQRQVQAAGQPFPVTAAVPGLIRGLLAAVEGEPHHQGFAAPLTHQGREPVTVVTPGAALAGRQRGHRQSQGVAAGDTDATATDIEGKHRTGTGRQTAAQRTASGTGRWPGLQGPTIRSRAAERRQEGVASSWRAQRLRASTSSSPTCTAP